MGKAITVDLPYPSLECIAPDARSARIIAPSYAGIHGELAAILQYVYHHFYFSREGNEQTASTLIGIAVAEMKHLEILGETLLRLGTDPVYSRTPPYKCDFFSAGFINYSKTARKMLMDDISGELIAINDYEKILSRLDDENAAAVISRLKLDEELHIRVLKAELEKLCR